MARDVGCSSEGLVSSEAEEVEGHLGCWPRLAHQFQPPPARRRHARAGGRQRTPTARRRP
jgi:hypothetical protein